MCTVPCPSASQPLWCKAHAFADHNCQISAVCLVYFCSGLVLVRKNGLAVRALNPLTRSTRNAVGSGFENRANLVLFARLIRNCCIVKCSRRSFPLAACAPCCGFSDWAAFTCSFSSARVRRASPLKRVATPNHALASLWRHAAAIMPLPC